MGIRVRLNYKLVAFLFCLLVTVILATMALVKKPADVELTLNVSQLSFKGDDGSVSRLFNAVNTKFVTLSRYERLTIDGGDLRFTEDEESPNGWRAAGAPNVGKSIVPNVPFSNITFESVTLNRLNIPPGTNTELSWNEDEPGGLNISLDKPVSGEVAGGGTLLFSCTDCNVEGVPATRNLPALKFRLTDGRQTGQTVRFQGSQDLPIVALVLASGTTLKTEDIDVREVLNFTRPVGDELVSTIIDSTIHFENVSEKRDIKLDEGTFLELGDPENVVIKTLKIENGIKLALAGRFGKLSTGAAGHVQDRRLSYLEWASTLDVWILVVSTAITITTLGINVYNGLRK